MHLSLCGVMGGRKHRGRPRILPAIYIFFLHPIKGHLQFFSTFFSATEFPHFCSFLFLFCRLPSRMALEHVLWDRNPGFLKSEIGPCSDFKRICHLMDLKSAHSQESDFQESGEVDRFLKMGTHFQERSGSLENGLCVTWSGFWLYPGYLWPLILVVVEQIYDQITRRLVAWRVAPAARVILSQTQACGDGGY